MKQIALASKSPRRSDILHKAGIEFHLVKSDYNEELDNKIFSYKKIEERIMYYLHAISLEAKSSKVNIKSVTNLAYILCLPRESVSRSLKHLILEGYISKKNNQITIL